MAIDTQPLTALVQLFQIASTFITGIGIIFSISLGIINLRNYHADRLAKIKPNLLFEPGGQLMTASISSTSTFPGKNINDGELIEFVKLFPNSPKLVLTSGFGSLVNHGQGLALETVVWFEADSISLKDKKRILTKNECEVPPYKKDWNQLPASPQNISSGGAASFSILPGAIFFAYRDRIKELSGVMHIECRDIEGNYYHWKQIVTFFLDAASISEVSITVTFLNRFA